MGEGTILHFGAVRICVTGKGKLNLKLLSFDDVESTTLTPLQLPERSARKLDRLTNFTSQAGRLRVSVDEFEGEFSINDITIFVKPIWSQFPGTY